MKKFLTILFLTIASIFTLNAHQRITPILEIDQQTYDEAIELIESMERLYRVERMEGIKLDADMLTTKYGEIILKRDGNSITVANGEFTAMIEKYFKEHRYQWYNIESIRTELILQNVKIFEYLYESLSKNRQIKSIYIEVEPKTGASYVRVNYYKL